MNAFLISKGYGVDLNQAYSHCEDCEWESESDFDLRTLSSQHENLEQGIAKGSFESEVPSSEDGNLEREIVMDSGFDLKLPSLQHEGHGREIANGNRKGNGCLEVCL